MAAVPRLDLRNAQSGTSRQCKSQRATDWYGNTAMGLPEMPEPILAFWRNHGELTLTSVLEIPGEAGQRTLFNFVSSHSMAVSLSVDMSAFRRLSVSKRDPGDTTRRVPISEEEIDQYLDFFSGTDMVRKSGETPHVYHFYETGHPFLDAT